MEHFKFPMRLVTAVCAIALTISASDSVAQREDVDSRVNPTAYSDATCESTHCHRCGSSNCQCELLCCPKKVIEAEEKSYWKVVCENICVPGFRFPWEKNCSPICGWVRTVNVLEEHSYECEVCGYEWTVKCVRQSTGARHRCNCPRCEANCPCASIESESQLPPVPVADARLKYGKISADSDGEVSTR